MARPSMQPGEICDAFTALLGFLALAESDEFDADRRAAFISEAVHQADRLRVLAGGDLVLVVSRNPPELQERLRHAFGAAPGVEITMDRRHAARDAAGRDERRRLDISQDLRRVGVGIGRPALAAERGAGRPPVVGSANGRQRAGARAR